MFFTGIMSNRIIYLFLGLAIMTLFYWIISDSGEDKRDFAERTRISLRDAGNQLLLSNQDSTSLIFPVKEVGPSKFELSFQNTFEVVPDSLVSIVQKSLEKANLEKSLACSAVNFAGSANSLALNA